MAQQTLTAIDALLKEVYSIKLQDQLQNEITTTKRLEQTSNGVIETVGGKYVDFPIHVGRNSGIGWRKENEALPAAGSQGYKEVHVPLQYVYGVFRVTGQLIELADKDHQAFASAMTEEQERLKDDLKKDYEVKTYGDGTGLLASVTADGSNTVTVDSVQFLEEGMQIDILTRSNGASVSINDRTITAIDPVTLIVTYSGSDGTATATEGIYRQGDYTAGVKRNLTGFGNIFSATSTLHGVSPSTDTRKWAAVVNAAGGVNRPLSEGLMIKVTDDVRIAGGGSTSAIFCSLGVRRSYFNLLTQQRRYTDTKKYAGGFEGLSFMNGRDIPVVDIVDAPPNKMFFVDESKMKIFRNKDWHFGQEDGHILKWVSGFDAYTGYYKKYSELGTTQRNAQGLLADITEA
jgi:hypothetical protein